MTTIALRNLDGANRRARPQPDCTCFVCSGPAKLLRPMTHPDTGKQTAGCETCYQKAHQASAVNPRLKETCPRCPKRVEWLKPAADNGQGVCLNCYEASRWASVVAPADAPSGVSAPSPLCQDCGAPFLAKSPEHLRCDTCLTAKYEAWQAALRETAPAQEHYCCECFEGFTPKYPHQHRCHDCAETIAAQWAAVPPEPKPPKLDLVRPVERLATFVLDNAMPRVLSFEDAYQARVNVVKRGLPTLHRRGQAQAWEAVRAVAA
jgi:hypothetical protein